jgi:hypothetical protein
LRGWGVGLSALGQGVLNLSSQLKEHAPLISRWRLPGLELALEEDAAFLQRRLQAVRRQGVQGQGGQLATEGAEALSQPLEARIGKSALGRLLIHRARALIAPRGAAPEPIEGRLVEALPLLPEQLSHLQGLAFAAPFHHKLIPGLEGRCALKGRLKTPAAQGEGALATLLE